MQDVTFGGLLSFYMKENRMTIKDLQEQLDEMGIKANYDTLCSYRAERSVPTFYVAKDVLKAFGGPLSDAELKEVIAESKRVRSETMNQTSYAFGLRLNMSEFDNMSVEKFKTDINIRINDLNKELGIKNVNAYITYLVKKDMQETVWAGKENNK